MIAFSFFSPVSGLTLLISQHWFQFSSVTQSCPTLGDPIDCSRPGFPVLHHPLELAQTHVHLHTDSDPASAEYGILSGR